MSKERKVRMINNIKATRLLKNITQESLARTCDITLRHMQRIESGESTPSIIIALKIKEALNVKNVEELFIID